MHGQCDGNIKFVQNFCDKIKYSSRDFVHVMFLSKLRNRTKLQHHTLKIIDQFVLVNTTVSKITLLFFSGQSNENEANIIGSKC